MNKKKKGNQYPHQQIFLRTNIRATSINGTSATRKSKMGTYGSNQPIRIISVPVVHKTGVSILRWKAQKMRNTDWLTKCITVIRASRRSLLDYAKDKNTQHTHTRELTNTLAHSKINNKPIRYNSVVHQGNDHVPLNKSPRKTRTQRKNYHQ